MRIPWTTVVAFVVTIAAIVVLTVTGHGSAPAFTVLIGILPSLLSTSFFAERTAKQTSNGHVVKSMKQAITELSAKAPEPPKEDNDGPIHG